MKTKNYDLINDNKIFAYLAAATIAILSIPFLAMQYTSQVDWDLPDFIIMGTLIFGMGFTCIHVARVVPKKYQSLTAIAFFAAFIIIWIHLAVGIVDTWPLAGS